MTAAIPEDSVGAFVPHTLTAPLAGRPGGPLAGRTFAVKDLYAIAGHRIANGNPDWFAAHGPAKTTAGAVQRLLDAGATCVGIAVCDEFFYSLLGTNFHYGTPLNARARTRVCGGSSCGSAAAVAAGMCDFSLGSDTGGSVRVPAAFCGLYGLRPTFGRIDTSGVTVMAESYDTAGHFAREAALFRDVGRVLLDGRTVAAPVGRLVVAEEAFARAEAPVRAALERALARLSGALPRPEPMTLVEGDADRWRDAFRVLQGFDVQKSLLPWVRTSGARLGPGIKERFDMAAAIAPAEAEAAAALRAEARRRMHAIAGPGTLIVLPAAPTLPPERRADGPALEAFRALTLQGTCPAGHAGLPQMSVPAGEAGGCPVGLSFIAWEGGDEALLDLAVRLEPLLDVR